ncbi:MAG: LysR substrate-binding domain-containing protein [Alphaproteobacteria bacterium]|nr:LysR substrate-binding domain-containing protein [Alphaproteobacteria bacterium]
MNLRDLTYLCAVAQTRHFGQAAEHCNVSQPTLSAQIRKLEDELGVTLFERTNKSVRLTPVGQEIVSIAQRIEQGAADIRRTATAHRDPLAGKVRLGIIPTIAPMIIPSLLSMTAQAFPNLHLSFVEDMTDPLLDMLKSGTLDAAILATNPDHPTLTEISLYDEPFWVAFPKGHRLETKAHLAALDVDPGELLLLSEGHCFRDQALSVCRHALVQNTAMPGTRATSMETILNLVAAGAGVTLVPALVTRGGRLAETGVMARPFDLSEGGDMASRRVRLVFRHATPRRRLMTALSDAIAADLSPLVRAVPKVN